jgi:hypothetical protein
MPNQKKVLFCVFEPEDPKSTEQMRQMFTGSYPIFAGMEAVEYKCWWVDGDRGQWGAFYVFRSAEELKAYVSSDRWLKAIPEKYGCAPTWQVMDVGLILSKKAITQVGGSWLE